MIAEVAATLEPGAEDITERQEKFEALIDQFEATEDPIRHGMATVMLSFLAGLFVGEEEYEAIQDNPSWPSSIAGCLVPGVYLRVGATRFPS